MNNENESDLLARLLANLESDPDIRAALQAEEQRQADAKFDSIKQQAFERVKNVLASHTETESAAQSGAVSPSITERYEKAAEQMAVGFKRLLSEFTAESFAAAHLGDDDATGDADVVRVIALNEYPALRTTLPWLGEFLRVYQHDHSSDNMTAKYIAIVETLEVEAPRHDGELHVVLSTDSGKRSDVRLSFDYPSCEFSNLLSANESQLTIECMVDSDA